MTSYVQGNESVSDAATLGGGSLGAYMWLATPLFLFFSASLIMEAWKFHHFQMWSPSEDNTEENPKLI